ncbi:hypothetical protein [Sphaerimonospora mesophila]|uniref:hypothetical protein n=1 Tax=Sphaerimonospora mesophila TaxID=37483 RepID=UPI00128F5B1E
MSEYSNLNDLVMRAKEGRVARSEIRIIADFLERNPQSPDAYKLLYVISRMGDRSYENLIAKFLSYSADPDLARLSLQTLCVFWRLSDRYLSEIERFLEGVDWDWMGGVRQIAITAAGEHLRDNVNCKFLAVLLRISSRDHSSELETRIAVEALARALGGLENPLPSEGEDWEKWAAGIVDRAKRRFEKECQKDA